MSDWQAMLKTACEEESCQAVANKIGVSRAAVSLVLRGKYPAKTDRIAARVQDYYSRIECPHNGRMLSPAECRGISTATAPTSSPQAMRQWRACQGCAHKGGKR